MLEREFHLPSVFGFRASRVEISVPMLILLKMVHAFENSSQLSFDVISKHTVFSNEIDISKKFVFFKKKSVFDPTVLKKKHKTF